MSGTNRIISYSRGIVEERHLVKVYIFKKTESKTNIVNKNHGGEFLGIHFQYPSRCTIKSENIITRLLEILFGILRTFKNIISDHNKNAYDVVLLSLDNPYIVLFYSFFLKLFGIQKIVLIVDEYPAPIRYGKKSLPSLTVNIFRLSFIRIDALISMTKVLIRFYERIISKSIPTLIVPITVEPQRFMVSPDSQSDQKYVAYIGNLGIAKDGVDILIESFRIFRNHFPEFHLYLCGEGNSEDQKKLEELVQKLRIEKCVHFLGDVHRDKIPIILVNAKILALARPDSKRSQGGFPTKLGEYLATGIPIIVTDVGEIRNYITDGKEAYIVKPGSVVDFANGLIQLNNNYPKAVEMGKRGRKLALTVFNYHNQAKRMITFFEEIK